MEIINIKSLRNKTQLKTIPAKTGLYRWFADKETTKTLLGDYFEPLKDYLTKGNGKLADYYYIYTGIATNDIISSRLDWHINQHHDIAAIITGFLSTFRQSISSLVSENQLDENKTNETLDKMYIEYELFDFPIKSKEANLEIKKLEKAEIENNYIPLNIQGNNSDIINPFKKYLKIKRKSGKKNAITLFENENKKEEQQ